MNKNKNLGLLGPRFYFVRLIVFQISYIEKTNIIFYKLFKPIFISVWLRVLMRMMSASHKVYEFLNHSVSPFRVSYKISVCFGLVTLPDFCKVLYYIPSLNNVKFYFTISFTRVKNIIVSLIITSFNRIFP